MKILEQVMESLKKAGFPVLRAYPGGQVRSISGLTAAVSLEQVDSGEKTVTVLVTMLCPAAQGGGACEDGAVRAGEALEKLGGLWRQSGCRFDGRTGHYYVRVSGTFSGGAALAAWQEKPGFTVIAGGIRLAHVTAVTVSLDEKDGGKWMVNLEEYFPPAVQEEAVPASPFTLTVSRDGAMESLTGCVWHTVSRKNTGTGCYLRRIAQAARRTVVDIL